MARITLEELNEMDDEVEDEEQEQDEAEQNRLFSLWETVASTHQVMLPQADKLQWISKLPCIVGGEGLEDFMSHAVDEFPQSHQEELMEEELEEIFPFNNMAGPIVQMTHHNHMREPVPYTILSQHEKCEETTYEERLYPAGKWACITKGEPKYEQSTSMGFMKLIRYICKENSLGRHLGMTVPVISEIHLNKEGTELVQEVITAYYVPQEFQLNPPIPMDPEIQILERSSLQVITREFYGPATEETILREIHFLWELLGSTDNVLHETYLVAAYQNPSVPNRRNEIWFIRRTD